MMTTKFLTGPLAKSSKTAGQLRCTSRERIFQIAFGAIQRPWLLKSLHGGKRAEKLSLLRRLDLNPDALPHLGSWKADTYLLGRVVDMIEEKRPATVVELGSGATSLVIAKALSLHGGGKLYSFDQHRPFISDMNRWLADYDLVADFTYAPLAHRDDRWPGLWYSLPQVPEKIDLLLIDGPPWAVHPSVRGMAELLFDRISPGGIVMLDDAARPGERYVGRRWRRAWPGIDFRYEGGGSKGLLIGCRKLPA